MERYSIALCVTQTFIFLMMFLCLWMIYYIRLHVRKNLAPYIYFPILFFVSFFLLAYTDIDFIIDTELGTTSIESDCVFYTLTYIPYMLDGLALSLNLAMWLDFVFCSHYSVKSEFNRYLRFRAVLFYAYILYAIVVVVVPMIVMSYF